MIEPERIRLLSAAPAQKGRYVLYWMQSAQRTEYNHALEYSINLADENNLPLIVFFGLTDSFKEASEFHYKFMLAGINELKEKFDNMKICFIIEKVPPEQGVLKYAENAYAVVTDDGYLKEIRKWKNFVSNRINCPLIEITTNVIIPVYKTSDKEEYSAATIRRKINKKIDYYLKETVIPKIKHPSTGMFESNLELFLPDAENSGELSAKKKLKNFIENKLENYSVLRNDPTLDYTSGMSPFLHFGQISPLYIALEVIKSKSKGTDVFLEELIVRRELAFNFVYYNKNYDSIESIPGWALNTLEKHMDDKKEYIYTPKELESGVTHDKYWNAAQNEMIRTGKMHGYMRMYWGKKIIEWSETPEIAFNTAIYLNNRYSLDGRDPNSYCGVAWCFGKHDRPWPERNIFGNIRYMNDSGLKRKFDADKYAAIWK